MQWPLSKIVIGALIVVIAGAGAIGAMKWLWPGAGDRRPKLVDVPPLSPVTRNSVIVTPVAISLTAIGDALEAAAPRDFSGKPSMPMPPFLANVDIGWSVARGPFVVAGRPDGLAISTTLNGSLRVAGQMTNPGGGPQDPPGGFPPRGFPGSAGRLPGSTGRLLRSSGRLPRSARGLSWTARRCRRRPGAERASPSREDGRAARRHQRQRGADGTQPCCCQGGDWTPISWRRSRSQTPRSRSWA